MPVSDADMQLYERARAASASAHAPYSGFAVGAALRVSGGAVVTGVNVENGSYGLTSCAERNAVFSAVGAGERTFEAIAVFADAASAAPCGACRQVLAEFAPDLRVIFRSEGEVVARPLSELLPDRFAL